MIRVIDLDIDGSLTGDTRVEEIALVQMPAIEQNFIYFTQQEFVDSITDYPQYITDTAKRAKKWVDENGYGNCMTPVGKSRLNQLANREPVSIETLKRMKAFGTRHKKDWEVFPFLHPVFVGGVGFNHYWPVGAMGRPAGTAAAIVNKLHMSCIAGHQQGKQVAYGKRADGKPICAIIAGSYYLHDESYMDQLSNRHWRGLLILNEVQDGHFDELFLSIEYLQRKYGQV